MQVFTDNSALQSAIFSKRQPGKSIGFVPTMGALHQGHLSLVESASESNQVVVISIFVNPTQFNNASDLERYPRQLDHDLQKLESISNADVLVYVPTIADVYGENIVAQHFEFDGLENELEGRFRPGHFDGVGTIIKFLFELIKPDNAYFGEKDFQQALIVKKLAEKLGSKVAVHIAPIFREPNGLAMSSRNERLTSEQREFAKFIYECLKEAKALFGTVSVDELVTHVKQRFDAQSMLKLEYFEIADAETLQIAYDTSANRSYRAFIAAFAGEVRLIDTISLN